eukprot:Rmarinus@m.6505
MAHSQALALVTIRCLAVLTSGLLGFEWGAQSGRCREAKVRFLAQALTLSPPARTRFGVGVLASRSGRHQVRFETTTPLVLDRTTSNPPFQKGASISRKSNNVWEEIRCARVLFIAFPRMPF